MSAACISPCGKYRYNLFRGEEPRMGWVMLNPSTADAELDDPTIRRCKGFALREGFAGIEVVNLFAFRATNPEALLHAADPEGPANIDTLAEFARRHKRIFCGWGAINVGAIKPGIIASTTALLTAWGAELVCFGKTKDGSPRHPLYVRGDAPMENFP